jgi:hypothetical protein
VFFPPARADIAVLANALQLCDLSWSINEHFIANSLTEPFRADILSSGRITAKPYITRNSSVLYGSTTNRPEARQDAIVSSILCSQRGASMGEALLIALIVASAAPACIPLLRDLPVSSQYWTAVVIFAVSAFLQAVFAIGVAKQFFTLDYSLRFAMFGMPSCICALVIAARGKDASHGAIISPSIGLVIWFLFVTAH